MPFVERENGQIVAIHARPQKGLSNERLAEDHPEVVAFRNRTIENPMVSRIQSANSINDVKGVLIDLVGGLP